MRIIIAVITALCATQAYAVCEGSKTLFFCNTQKGGKQIIVCDSGKTIDYSFGKAAKPDVAVKVARDVASTRQWDGMGGSMSYSVDIPNKSAVYNVFWSANRNDDAHGIEAGVNVFVDKKLKATLKCNEKDLVNNIEGVQLKPTTD